MLKEELHISQVTIISKNFELILISTNIMLTDLDVWARYQIQELSLFLLESVLIS